MVCHSCHTDLCWGCGFPWGKTSRCGSGAIYKHMAEDCSKQDNWHRLNQDELRTTRADAEAWLTAARESGSFRNWQLLPCLVHEEPTSTDWTWNGCVHYPAGRCRIRAIVTISSLVTNNTYRFVMRPNYKICCVLLVKILKLGERSASLFPICRVLEPLQRLGVHLDQSLHRSNLASPL